MPPRPFEHQDADRKPDEALRAEARAHLGATPHLQLVAELLGRLRALDLPWWTAEMQRERWSATERMRWYRARPDLRQKITTSLTGLAPRAARKKTPDFQGALLDSVIDEGDVAPRAFENAYDPGDLVTYGPVESFWHAFIEKMPWAQDTPAHQELIAWLFDALLADHGAVDGVNRTPILTAWDARTAIDGRVWHTKMPLEIRMAIDEARFKKQRERPGEPFHAESDLSIAVAATITSSIPLRDLRSVFAAAERAMGFSPAPRPGPPLDPKRPEGATAALDAPAASRSISIPPAGSGNPNAGPTSTAAVSTPPASLQVASQPRPSTPPPGLAGPPVSGPRAVSTPPPSLGQPPAPTPAARPIQAAIPAQNTAFPGDRPSSPGARVELPIERPTTPSARYDLPPTSGATPRNEGAARAAAAAAILAGMPSARGSAATLLDALADIPAEEERTNPWDIPSEDASVDNDETGTTSPARRDGTTSSGKRKRHGKG
ncbi:MAG: hypothetical protein ABJE95_09165 [Byssovorax sp.]